MLGRIQKEKYFCGMDIGSRDIKAGVFRVPDNGRLDMMAAGVHKTYGIQDMAIQDLGELTECIHHILNELIQKTSVQFKEIYLGLGAQWIQARPSRAVIPLTERDGKVIIQRDMQKVTDQARLLGIKMEEEIVHHLPQYYIVDETQTSLNPLGLYGRKLGVQSLMIFAGVNAIRSLIKAVHQAGFDVAEVVFDAYASSRAVLTEQDRQQGCILADIGAKMTTLLVFQEGILHSVEKIEIGGDDLTRGIARELCLPLDLAEEIKKSYASVSRIEEHLDEEILVKRESGYRPIKRDIIYRAIEPAIGTLIESVKTVLTNGKARRQFPRGLTIIGGGAILPGLLERMEEALQMPVQLGKIQIPLHKGISQAAVLSPVIGLAVQAMNKNSETADAFPCSGSRAQRIAHRLKELYLEYF